MCVIADDRDLLAWLEARVPVAGEAGNGGGRTFRIRRDRGHWALEEDGRDYVFEGSRAAAANRFLERLNELACFTNPALTVHSGLVADGRSRGIWIPAASGGGKSTLTAQLALSGLRYATDEAVTVNANGQLTGWPKWLCLKRGSHETLHALAPGARDLLGEDEDRRWIVPPREVGATVRDPVIADVIAFPQYREGAPIKEHVISKAEAVAEIVPQAFNLQRHGIEGVNALARVIRRAHACVRVTYGDGWEASRLLMDLLGSAPAAE